MEHQLGYKVEQCRNLVCRALCGVIVTCVNCRNLAVLCSICGIEVVGTYGEALQADTEQLALDAVFHILLVLCKNLVQGVLEQAAVQHMVHRDILATVVHPYIQDTGVALSLTHCVGDVTAALGVLDPEVADTLVGIGEGEVATLRVGERSGVEVQFGIVFLTPLYPTLEIIYSHLVAIHNLALEIAVNLVQIQAVGTGNQALGLEHIGAQFIYNAGCTGIIAGGLDTAREGACLHFKTLYVICLPAVHREVEILELLQDFVGVDAYFGVTFFGQFVGLDYLAFFHFFIDLF